MMKQVSLFDQVVAVLGDFARRHNFTITMRGNLGDTRGAAIDLENEKFIISVLRELTFVGNEDTIWIHCKMRPRPKAHLRTYSVNALSAFVQGVSDPFPLRSFSVDAEDLLQYEDKFLSVDLLNSECPFGKAV